MANPFYEVFSATIPLSGTQSEIVTIFPSAVVGVYVPAMGNSTAIAVQGNTTLTSASFTRIYKTDATTHYTIPGATTSYCAVVYDSIFPMPYLRFESLVAVYSATTFQVIVKR